MGNIDENVFRFFCNVRDIIENEAAVTAGDALLIIDDAIIGSDCAANDPLKTSRNSGDTCNKKEMKKRVLANIS